MFEIVGTKSLDSNAIEFTDEGINFIGRTFENNGIQGKIQKRDFEPNEPFTITATVIGNYKYVKYQKEPYYCSQNINKLTPKETIKQWSENIAYFFIANIQRFVSLYDGQQGGYKLDDINNHIIQLPLKENALAFSNPCDNIKNIDFDFMESFIRELEEERIRELNAYLQTTGLKDYELTTAEQQALNAFEHLEWGEYKIGDLFEKLNLSFNKSKFNKNTDISKSSNAEFSLPLVNAKDGNNGIMYYGRPEDFESAKMTIDIINDGAISAGNVYSQPQETGVLYNAYLIKPKFYISTNLLHFFTVAIRKSIKMKFSYELKATWERVKKETIYLPTNNGTPDYTAMETFISAVQKLVIKDVVQYADKRIAATAQMVK